MADRIQHRYYERAMAAALVRSANTSFRQQRLVFLILNITAGLVILSSFLSTFGWMNGVQERLAKQRSELVSERGINAERIRRFRDTLIEYQKPCTRASSDSSQIMHIGPTIYLQEHLNYLLADSERIANDIEQRKGELQLVQNVVEEHLDIFTIPLVGLTVSSNDVTITSAFVLYFLAYWLFFTSRRETSIMERIIQYIKRDLRTGKSSINILSERELESPDIVQIARYFSYSIAFSFVLRSLSYGNSSSNEKIGRMRSIVYEVIIFSPFWVVILLLLLDMYSMLYPSTLVHDTARLYESILPSEKISFACLSLLSLIFAVGSYRFACGTRDLVDQAHSYAQELENLAKLGKVAVLDD